MAITKTTSVTRVQVHYDQAPAIVEVLTKTVWDDPDDAELPIERGENKLIRKMTISTFLDETTGGPVHSESPTDYSGEDAKVIAICDLVWA